MSTFFLDIGSVTAQIAQMVKDCMEVARDQIASSIGEIQVKAPETYDIAGIREQILANTIFLLPFVMPEARQQTTFENVSYTVEPKVYIVVSGAKPYVRAYVMVGYEFHSQKSKMFYGNYADTTGEALDKLLKVTMNLVSKVKHRVVSASRFAIDDVGGYYAGNPRMSPEQVDEDRWWGSSKGNSPVFSCKPNFTNRMPTPETDDETAHPIGNDNGGVNIHGTANANGGSASGNGMKISGLNGSFDDIASGSDTA